MRCLIVFIAFFVANARASTDDTFPLLMPRVHPEHEESYLCTPVKLDDERTHYVRGFKPNASMHTAHHILIYGCEEPGSDEPVWNCGEMMAKEGQEPGQAPCKSGPQILYAWAMNAPELKLPEGVGFRVGKDSSIKYLVLQVHYLHLDHIPETGDDSGVFLDFTSRPQPKAAGVLLLGTAGSIPAHTTTFFETACEIDDERTIHPFAYRVHTHALGKVVSGWRVRDRVHWSALGKQNPQKPQMFNMIAGDDASDGVELKKGDVVAARCTMVNHNDEEVKIGSTKKDEMCNFYLMYWTHGERPMDLNTCFTPGPPNWSWFTNTELDNIPDMEASTI